MTQGAGIDWRPEILAACAWCVSAYRAQYDPDTELRWFGARTLSPVEAIRRAALTVGPWGVRGNDVIHPHQCRIGAPTLGRAAEALAREADMMLAAREFETALVAAEAILGPIPRIGELAIYDITHRIGMRMGYEPQAVYLHAGTREGAVALGFSGSLRSIPVSAFPMPLQQLSAAEIEDVLCIYKAWLRGARDGYWAPAQSRGSCHRAPQRRKICGNSGPSAVC